MSRMSEGSYYSARGLSSAVGSRVERTCSVCGKPFMMNPDCHVYRTDPGVQCSWSCYRRAKEGKKRKHQRKPRERTCADPAAMRAQCIAVLAKNQDELEGTHGKERERVSARIAYWRRKLAETEHDAAYIRAAKEDGRCEQR